MTIIDDINRAITEIYQAELDKREMTLAMLIKENDFLCGDILIKNELERMYPNMKIMYSPLIDSRELIMIKKWNIDDWA